MVESASLLLSRSHQDVADVAREPVAKTRLAGSVPPRRGEDVEAGQAACQEHENEPAEVVIVCEPEGTSLMMGGLHPRYVYSVLTLLVSGVVLGLLAALALRQSQSF